MKVRHKRLGVEFDVKPFRDDVHIADSRYYETVGGSFIAHQDGEWELIRPERWVNVTDDCDAYPFNFPERTEYDSTFYISHQGGLVMERDGYRLNKIQLREEISYQGMWVFVVEQKQPGT